ncbi:MAG: DNA repair protein RecO [Porticoccaceae bacterium]
MKRVQNQPAYVLHRCPYRESSLLVDLFAREHGRLRAVARGIRGGKFQALQPFVALEVAWSGSGTLKTLTQVEVAAPSSPRLAGRALYLGLYVNELLVRLLHEYDPHPGLHARYRQLLQDLAGSGDAEPLLRRFELALLAELGYGLTLDRDGHTGLRVVPDVDYVYVADTGLVRRDAANGDAARQRLSGRHLLAMMAEDYSEAGVRQCAKELLRAALADHLGGRPLRSRELFRKPATTGGGIP